MNSRLDRRTDNASNVIDSIDLNGANDMLKDCHSELFVNCGDRAVIDDAAAKLDRIVEIADEMTDAWQDIIDIFRNAAADCEVSE